MDATIISSEKTPSPFLIKGNNVSRNEKDHSDFPQAMSLQASNLKNNLQVNIQQPFLTSRQKSNIGNELKKSTSSIMFFA
jgi:hypothetical protein